MTGKSKLPEALPIRVWPAVWNYRKLMFGLWFVSAGIAALPLFVVALQGYHGLILLGFGLAAMGTLALLVFFVLAVIAILQERPARRKKHAAILDVIDRMNGFYLEFRGTGPFSLSHLERRVSELAESGVVWPSGLLVPIEDMKGRGFRSFWSLYDFEL